jgi:hypothetical protein
MGPFRVLYGAPSQVFGIFLSTLSIYNCLYLYIVNIKDVLYFQTVYSDIFIVYSLGLREEHIVISYLKIGHVIS